MNTKTVKAICLKRADYLDFDKMLLLYSLEEGKLSAHIKGVKKPQAKLKFAAQQFCFGDYQLSEKNGRFLVINCTEIESFFDLRKDIDAFTCACVMTEFVSVVGQENESNASLFLLLIKSLIKLTEDIVPKLVLTKFLLEGIKIAGFGLFFDKCNCCSSTVFSKLYIDNIKGGAVCQNCISDASLPLSPAVLNCFRQVDNTSLERISILKIDVYLNEMLLNLSSYIQNLIKKLNSIQFLL